MDLGRLLTLGLRGQTRRARPSGERQNRGERGAWMILSPEGQFGEHGSLEASDDLVAKMLGSSHLAAPVTRAQALQVPAVLRARNLIAGTLSTLPLRRIDRGGRRSEWSLFDQPDPDLATEVVWAMTYEDLLFEGISWWRVLDFDGAWPIRARRVPVSSVHVAPAGGSGVRPSQQRITPDQPYPVDGQVFIDGLPVSDREVIAFVSPNPPLLHHAARAIRTALTLDSLTASYAESPFPLGYFKRPEGGDPIPDEEVEQLLTDWEQKRRKRHWAYIGGLQLESAQWDPEKLQLADQRQHAVLEIARATGIDPEDLGVSTTSRTYANAEQRRLDLLDFSLGHYVSAVQGRLSMRDVVPDGNKARVDFGGFLRSATLNRMQSYDIGLNVGAYTLDEIRDLENRPRLTPAQKADVERRRGTSTGSQSMEHGSHNGHRESVSFDSYDDDGVARVMFDDAEVVQAFRVNREKRTVSGIAVPWGRAARSGFARWRFAEGSLRWSSETRVKLNLHHDFDRMIGRAIRLQSTSRGLDATFKIARGEEGDRALDLAEDEVLDGFSVEVNFDGDGDDWQPDPADESVRLVRQATLRGVALTGMPAFDDARVSNVRATQKESRMPESDHDRRGDTDPQPRRRSRREDSNDSGGRTGTRYVEDGPPVDGQDNEISAQSAQEATEQQFTQAAQRFADSLNAVFDELVDRLPDPQRSTEDRPVRAARATITREEPVYTMGGGRGPSLIKDAFYAMKMNDHDAKNRVEKFRRQQADLQTLAGQRRFVDTTTASEIIPPGYRPDLFVTELTRGRPLTNSLSRGVITDATPFTVPTFTSSSGATGDHTEGTNPTPGTIQFGSKTIQPGAISGSIRLTREIVDAANPAIDAIALSTMRESYARQTEQKVATMLEGTDGAQHADARLMHQAAGTDPTADGAGATLIDSLRDQLAEYPFFRFAPPDVGTLSQQGTKLLAGAKDNQGRHLLPSVGAQNAAGLGNAVAQGWFVDGLAYVPAWALTGSDATDVGVFTMNSMDAWYWESPLLTFRFEEKLGPAEIELAMFSYFAVQVLRPAGISALSLTAAPGGTG